MLMRPAKFFEALRKGRLGPTLSQEEVDGCNAILDACADLPLAYVAYALATAFHETAHTMEPVRERGGDRYLFRLYDPQGLRPKKAADLGNIYPGDGVRYCGRGYPQTTGRRNYRIMGQELGLPLEDEPDLMLKSDVAARAMRVGMEKGIFTGRSFRTFLPADGLATEHQFTQARPIINGYDDAELIAGYAMDFQDALVAGAWTIKK